MIGLTRSLGSMSLGRVLQQPTSLQQLDASVTVIGCSLIVEQRRFKARMGKTPWFYIYNKRHKQPIPQHKWDFKDLQQQTGGEYTAKPLKVKRLEGRHPETGKRVNFHIGGGVDFDYLMIDDHRGGTEDSERLERVLEVRRDPNTNVYVALVAGKENKRWIIATDGMKADDLISSTLKISKNPITGVSGNAYPIGSLEVGTEICCIEQFPGEGTKFGRAPGTSYKVIRHLDEHTVIAGGHGHEYALRKLCQATVGRVSHPDWNKKWYGSPNMLRRFGWDMGKTARFKKDGHFGRKIRAPPPTRYWNEQPEFELVPQQWTISRWQLNCLFGTKKVHPLFARNTARLFRNL